MFKKLMVFLFVMIAFTGIFISCSDDDSSSSTGPDTTAPTVWIAAPADSFEVIDGIPVTITAGVSDNKGVVKVEFYVDSILASTDSVPSVFEYIWGTVGKEGDHIVYLHAYDAAGNIGESEVITITVTPPQTLTVNSPNGSETWNRGTLQNIIWNVNTVDTLVRIELLGAAGYVLSASTANDGLYEWQIPAEQVPANDYMIKITGLQTTINDTSNSTFTITDSPFIQVMSPNGGESWAMSTDQTITWQDNLTEDVKIELFKGAALELTISDSTASDGSYSWSIPNNLSVGSNYKIKVTSIPVNTVADQSDATFSITAK